RPRVAHAVSGIVQTSGKSVEGPFRRLSGLFLHWRVETTRDTVTWRKCLPTEVNTQRPGRAGDADRVARVTVAREGVGRSEPDDERTGHPSPAAAGDGEDP